MSPTGNPEDDFDCIQRMDGTGDYLSRWKSIRQIWAPRLDKGPVSQKEDFTPHNYSNHCVGIYKIMSEILIPKSAYGNELKQESLFVLNVAVLLHDIMMTFKPSARFQHSKEAKEFIEQHFLVEDFNITPQEMESIALVILGHSDIKDETTKTTIETIDILPKEADFFTGLQGKINVRLLAALLRLSDELDIHTGRIHGYNSSRREIKESSRPHWRRCEILSYPQKNPDNVTAIQLVPFESQINAEGNIDNDVSELIEVRNKISKELVQLNDKVFNKGYLSGWNYREIQIKATGELLEAIKRIDAKALNPFSAEVETPVKEEPAIFGDSQTDASKENFEVINGGWRTKIEEKEVEDQITSWVLQKELLRSGHFKVGNEFRVRDWIDTQGLLDDGKCLDYITDIFARKIIELRRKQFIVGIDHYGLLIASVLGLKTNSPFSYVISERLSASHIDKEKEIIVPPGHDIVIVTDAIITFNTVLTARKYLIDNYSISDENITGIYSVFQRGELLSCEGPHCDAMLEKVFVLNKSFPVEICTKKHEECIFVTNNKDLYCNTPHEV